MLLTITQSLITHTQFIIHLNYQKSFPTHINNPSLYQSLPLFSFSTNSNPNIPICSSSAFENYPTLPTSACPRANRPSSTETGKASAARDRQIPNFNISLPQELRENAGNQKSNHEQLVSSCIGTYIFNSSLQPTFNINPSIVSTKIRAIGTKIRY